MKLAKKILLTWLLFSLPLFLIACGTTPNDTTITSPANGEKINDNTYIYYYGQTCSHCKKVEDYLKKSWVDQRINIVPKEVQMNETNRQELLSEAERLGVPLNQVGTPFIIVQQADGTESTLLGEVEAIEHFKELEEQVKALPVE